MKKLFKLVFTLSILINPALLYCAQTKEAAAVSDNEQAQIYARLKKMKLPPVIPSNIKVETKTDHFFLGDEFVQRTKISLYNVKTKKLVGFVRYTTDSRVKILCDHYMIVRFSKQDVSSRIERLEVARDYRCQGFANLLLHLAGHNLLKQDCTVVSGWSVSSAVAIYKKYGAQFSNAPRYGLMHSSGRMHLNIPTQLRSKL